MKTTDRDIKRLLDTYFDERRQLDGRTVQIIQGWLEERLSHDNGEPYKLGGGEVDAELRRIFARTLSEGKPGTDKYTRESLARLHDELGFTDRRMPRNVVPLNRRRSASRRSLRLALVGVVAAAVVAVALLIPGLFPTHTDPTAPAMVAMSAAPHEIRDVTLPDGSTARLKAGTNITFSEVFDDGRTISLDGEAFFTVKHDTEHPFMVKAENMTVTVLGTEFNVKAWSGDATSEVMLASGSVEVQTGENVERLMPGQQAMIDRASGSIAVSEVEQADILRVRGINLSFDGVSLDRAFEMTADYYGVSVDVAAGVPEVESIVVKLDDGATLEKTLWFLQQVVPVFDYTIADDKVTIGRK